MLKQSNKLIEFTWHAKFCCNTFSQPVCSSFEHSVDSIFGLFGVRLSASTKFFVKMNVFVAPVSICTTFALNKTED